MDRQDQFSAEEVKYLKLLSKRFPTIQTVSSEIINLRAILDLPKGTEHFMSDLHGEHEAFLHILNNCSGVIREKVDIVFGNSVFDDERASLATLIYYPEEKLEKIKEEVPNLHQWYRVTFTGSLKSAGGSPPNTPVPRCAKPCPAILPTSSMSCCTPTTTPATRSSTTTKSSTPLWTSTGRTPSSSPLRR